MKQEALPKLWKHQASAIERAKKSNFFALFFDAGTGKSRTLLEILMHKQSVNPAKINTLILCPPVVISNWKQEILKYTNIQNRKIVMLTGTGRQRALALSKAETGSVVITNYESLLMKDVYTQMFSFLSLGVSCLVCDEAHKLKDPSAKRTKKATELAMLTTYRYLLTGTPILNNLMDIFSQFRILDGGKAFGSNFFTFRARYFEDKNKYMPASKHFPNWQPTKSAVDNIKSIIEPVSAYAEKKYCLDLPPFVRKTIEVPMGKEQFRLYEDMRKDLVATIQTDAGDTHHSIAELAITKALRLQQIVSGHLKTEMEGSEARTFNIKDNPRKAALRDILENLTPNHKVIVWAVFHANYDDVREVCESLRVKYSELHGLIKDKDAEAARFREDPETRVLIGHPGSGGIGVNLVEASYMVYYSRSFSLEYDIQSEARAYRGGSEMHESITRIDLCCPGTIDELVLKSLANKQQLSDKVLKQHLGEI